MTTINIDRVEKKAQQLSLENENEDALTMMKEDLHHLFLIDKPILKARQHLKEPRDEQLVRRDKKLMRDFELELIGCVVAPLEAIDPRVVSLGLNLPQQQEEEKTTYIDHSLIANSAVQELCTLANDNNGIIWTKSPMDGRDILDEKHYQRTFPRPNSSSSSWTEGSRASTVVNMEPMQLAHKLTGNKWSELFPTIVLEAIKIRVLFNGSSLYNPDGSLQLIYTELQATTPLVPKRSFVFLRTCKQIDQLTWVVADVPIEPSGIVGYPSGCWIQGTAERLSKVIWVEHFKIEHRSIPRKIYNILGHIGLAFGAERWVACLEQSCERKSYEMQTLPGGNECDYEIRYMMLLGQRMVDAFCQIVSPTIDDDPWSFVSGPKSLKIYATLRESPYYDDPKEMVIVATTTFLLREYSPKFVLEILGDERRRHEWDLSGRPEALTDVGYYTTGKDPWNAISVFEIDESSGHQILQETSVNRSGSLVVWSTVRYKKNDDEEPCCLPLNTLSV